MPAPAVETIVRTTAAPCLKIRPSPDTGGEPIACLVPGTHLSVLETAPYWRRVRLEDGREGWAAKKFLEPADPSPDPPPLPLTIPSNAWLEVHFVDVGQGDAVWIHTFDDGIDGNGIFEGRNVVIDGGPNSSDDGNPLLAYLQARAYPDAALDALILTHAHTDHFSGAETLSRHFLVHDYYDPGFPSTLVSYGAFLQAIRGSGEHPPRAERIHLGRDQFGSLDWGAEVKAEVFYAWPGQAQGLGSGNTLVNNSSMVLRLEYGQQSFLFMGDAEGKDRNGSPEAARYVEKILLETLPAAKLKANVLKIAHHGSETSSTLPFIQAVDPDVVVVCSGRKSFGGTFLPDASTLRRYCCHKASTRICRTDQNDEAEGRTAANDEDGDHVIIRTNGATLEVQAFEAGQPFEVSACEPGCSN